MKEPFETVTRGPIDRFIQESRDMHCELYSVPTTHFYLVNILRLKTFENDVERNVRNHLQYMSKQNVK